MARPTAIVAGHRSAANGRRLGRRVALRKLAQCLPGFLRPGEGRLELQRLLELALGRFLIPRRELRNAEVIADHGVVGELRRSLLEKRDRPRVDPRHW